MKPLSAHAIGVLRSLMDGKPMPRQEMNPGVAFRFEREALTETLELPSPYSSHKKGRLITHVRITQAGRDKIAQVDERK
jgi:hypothetical protein